MSSSDRNTAVRRAALPFRLHASVTCPPPAELATSLAWELGDLDVERVERALDALSPRRRPSWSAPRRTSCARSARRRSAPSTVGGPETLLLDRTLERGHGHPILVAIVLAEIGRRAGVPIGIVAGATGHFVAHQRLTQRWSSIRRPAPSSTPTRSASCSGAAATRSPRSSSTPCSRATNASATSRARSTSPGCGARCRSRTPRTPSCASSRSPPG